MSLAKDHEQQLGAGTADVPEAKVSDEVRELVEQIISGTTMKSFVDKQKDAVRQALPSFIIRADEMFAGKWQRIVMLDLIEGLKENPDDDNEDPTRPFREKLREAGVSLRATNTATDRMLAKLIELRRGPILKPGKVHYVIDGAAEEVKLSEKAGNTSMKSDRPFNGPPKPK